MRAAYAENWAHARHAQELRERFNNLYWVSWVAVLSARSGLFGGPGAVDAPALFAFFVILSAVVISASLKWTAEFSNHVVAAYWSAVALGLNVPIPGIAGSSRRLLPFPEFRGYAAFPLEAPIYLNVGATIIVAECLGLTAAVYLATSPTFGPIIGTLLTIAAFVVSVVVCFRVMHLTDRSIRARIPAFAAAAADNDPPPGG